VRKVLNAVISKKVKHGVECGSTNVLLNPLIYHHGIQENRKESDETSDDMQDSLDIIFV
jgi:hypothetical protein